MNAYIFQAALLCPDCAEKIMGAINLDPFFPVVKAQDSDHYPQGPYSNGGGEADCPQHCDHCRVFLENPLTEDGARYVRHAAQEFEEDYRPADESWEDIARKAEESGAPVVAEWIRFYFAWG